MSKVDLKELRKGDKVLMSSGEKRHVFDVTWETRLSEVDDQPFEVAFVYYGPRPRQYSVDGLIFDRDLASEYDIVEIFYSGRVKKVGKFSEFHSSPEYLEAKKKWEAANRKIRVSEVIYFPEPHRSALERGDKYFVPVVVIEDGCNGFTEFEWRGNSLDYKLLEKGMIHLKAENAKLHGVAMGAISVMKRGTEEGSLKV